MSGFKSRRTHLSRSIIFVDDCFLKELVEGALVLGERVARDFVDENFESLASFFDETGVEYSVVVAKGQETIQRLSGEGWDNYLK